MRAGRILEGVLAEAKIDAAKLLHAWVNARIDEGLNLKGMAAELGVSPNTLNSELKRRGIRLARKVSLSIEEGMSEADWRDENLHEIEDGELELQERGGPRKTSLSIEDKH